MNGKLFEADVFDELDSIYEDTTINYFLDCSASFKPEMWKQELAEIEDLKKAGKKVNVFYVSDHIHTNEEDARKEGGSNGFAEVYSYAKARPMETCIVRTDDDYLYQGGKGLGTLPNVTVRIYSNGDWDWDAEAEAALKDADIETKAEECLKEEVKDQKVIGELLDELHKIEKEEGWKITNQKLIDNIIDDAYTFYMNLVHNADGFEDIQGALTTALHDNSSEIEADIKANGYNLPESLKESKDDVPAFIVETIDEDTGDDNSEVFDTEDEANDWFDSEIENCKEIGGNWEIRMWSKAKDGYTKDITIEESLKEEAISQEPRGLETILPAKEFTLSDTVICIKGDKVGTKMPVTVYIKPFTASGDAGSNINKVFVGHLNGKTDYTCYFNDEIEAMYFLEQCAAVCSEDITNLHMVRVDKNTAGYAIVKTEFGDAGIIIQKEIPTPIDVLLASDKKEECLKEETSIQSALDKFAAGLE